MEKNQIIEKIRILGIIKEDQNLDNLMEIADDGEITEIWLKNKITKALRVSKSEINRKESNANIRSNKIDNLTSAAEWLKENIVEVIAELNNFSKDETDLKSLEISNDVVEITNNLAKKEYSGKQDITEKTTSRILEFFNGMDSDIIDSFSMMIGKPSDWTKLSPIPLKMSIEQYDILLTYRKNIIDILSDSNSNSTSPTKRKIFSNFSSKKEEVINLKINWLPLIKKAMKRSEEGKKTIQDDIILFNPIFAEISIINNIRKGHLPLSAYHEIIDNSISMLLPGSLITVDYSDLELLQRVRNHFIQQERNLTQSSLSKITNINIELDSRYSSNKFSIIPMRIEELLIQILRTFRVMKEMIGKSRLDGGENPELASLFSPFEYYIYPLNLDGKTNLSERFSIGSEEDIIEIFFNKRFRLFLTPLANVISSVVKQINEKEKDNTRSILVIRSDGEESEKTNKEVVENIINPIMRGEITVLLTAISNDQSETVELISCRNLNQLLTKLKKDLVKSEVRRMEDTKSLTGKANDKSKIIRIFNTEGIGNNTGLAWMEMVDRLTPVGTADTNDDYFSETFQAFLKNIINLIIENNKKDANKLWDKLRNSMKKLYELNSSYPIDKLTKKVDEIYLNFEDIRSELMKLTGNDLSKLYIFKKSVLVDTYSDILDELSIEMIDSAMSKLDIRTSNELAIYEEREIRELNELNKIN